MKCCMNCKYCIIDFSVDSIECAHDDGEWVYQESERWYNPYTDYCTEYKEEEYEL